MQRGSVVRSQQLAVVSLVQRAAARAEANPRVRIDGGGFRIAIPPIDVDAIYEQAREAIERSRFSRFCA